MTNNNSSVVKNDVPATAPDPYSQAVATIQQALDMILAAIPATPLKDQSPIAYVRKRQAVQPELISRAVTAAGTTPGLPSLLYYTDSRNTPSFTNASHSPLDT